MSAFLSAQKSLADIFFKGNQPCHTPSHGFAAKCLLLVVSPSGFSYDRQEIRPEALDNFDLMIRNLPTISQFKKALLRLIRHLKKSLYVANDTIGIKLLTRLQLRVGLNDLNLHKFNHNRLCDLPIYICACGMSLLNIFLALPERYFSVAYQK